MSNTFYKIKELVSKKKIKISSHGYDELAEDNIFIKDILENIKEAIIIEDYQEYQKGPCVLVLQMDRNNNPIHVVWGIPKGFESPAVLVTAYRPEENSWTDNFSRRKK